MLDRVVGEYLLAEYLLHILVMSKNKKYVMKYNIPGTVTDISVFLPILAERLNQKSRSGGPNIHNAIALFLKHFRTGEFGGFTLDKIPSSSTINNNLL
jgi:ribosome biogenesis GTPase A